MCNGLKETELHNSNESSVMLKSIRILLLSLTLLPLTYITNCKNNYILINIIILELKSSKHFQ